MKTMHFNIYTGYAPTGTIYQAYQDIAKKWDAFGVKSIRFFDAGFVNTYVSIRAENWWDVTKANDPDWDEDAADCLAKYKLSRKILSSKPNPTKRWMGQWVEFTNVADMELFLIPKLERLNKRTK